MDCAAYAVVGRNNRLIRPPCGSRVVLRGRVSGHLEHGRLELTQVRVRHVAHDLRDPIRAGLRLLDGAGMHVLVQRPPRPVRRGRLEVGHVGNLRGRVRARRGARERESRYDS